MFIFELFLLFITEIILKNKSLKSLLTSLCPWNFWYHVSRLPQIIHNLNEIKNESGWMELAALKWKRRMVVGTEDVPVEVQVRGE